MRQNVAGRAFLGGRVRAGARAASAVFLFLGMLGAAGAAERPADAPSGDGLRPGGARVRHGARLAARPLTVRVRPNRILPREARRDDAPPVDDFVFRDWNDTRLRTLYGFRLGGNVFYGDGRGDPINYGNATLAGIAGYGGARGGFGGPHFDSVGGFHPGPGPEYKESLDYASGRIWTPEYDVPQPRYPSVSGRVAALNAGIAPAGYVVGGEPRARPAVRYTSTRVRQAPSLPAPTPPAARDGNDEDGGRPATADDIFPAFDLDAL